MMKLEFQESGVSPGKKKSNKVKFVELISPGEGLL